MNKPRLNILLNILLIALAASLLAISFGVLLGFFQSIGWIYHSAGHGLGNLGYLIYGALFGAALGLLLSTYIVLKQPDRIKSFFLKLTLITITITSTVFISVNYFGVQW